MMCPMLKAARTLVSVTMRRLNGHERSVENVPNKNFFSAPPYRLSAMVCRPSFHVIGCIEQRVIGGAAAHIREPAV